MTSPLLHPSGRPWTASDINDLHRLDDVDAHALAHHHTLGNKRNQAAPGDHNNHGLKLVLKGGTGQSAGIELGNTDGTATTPYIDFHSSGSDTDFDSRIIASGNRASGNETLKLDAQYVQLGTDQSNSGTDFLACDATNEGGQANFKGAGAYGDVNIDNFQGNLRFLTAGGVPYIAGTSGEINSKRDNKVVEAAQGNLMMKSGSFSVSFTASASGTVTVTFSGDAFSSAPIVLVSLEGGSGSTGGGMRVDTITASSCRIVGMATASITSTWTGYWLAMGPP
jgi:hypothetical protein